MNKGEIPTIQQSTKKMTYGDSNVVRMSNGRKNAALPAAEAGTTPFRKAGEEFVRLRAIMEAKGASYNSVTARSVTIEYPWFLTFKLNSLKASITALKQEFNMRGNVEALRKLLLTMLFDLTSLTTGVPKPIVVPAPKRVATVPPPAVTPANKKQTLETTKFMVSGVVTQALYTDDQSRERLVIVVTLPANVTNSNQLTVNFVPSSNGARILLWVPRGRLANNMDKLFKGIATMPGFTKTDASVVTRALADKLKLRRENNEETIIDPIGIILDKACDPNKKPNLAVFKSKEDGDTVCVIVLDVLAKNDYGQRNTGGEAVMLD
jgi:hypothetical protein